MIKHRLNTVKHSLLVEKDRGNACRKNQEKNEPFFFGEFFYRSQFLRRRLQLILSNVPLESQCHPQYLKILFQNFFIPSNNRHLSPETTATYRVIKNTILSKHSLHLINNSQLAQTWISPCQVLQERRCFYQHLKSYRKPSKT